MKTMDKIRFRAMLPRYLSIQSPPPPLMDKHPSLFWRKNKYRGYSSERPGASFNFGFLKGGVYSREALIEYIKETSKYFQLVSLIKQ